MCERDDFLEGVSSDWTVNRRQFALGAAAVLGGCAAVPVSRPAKTSAQRVAIRTRDGTMDAFFVRPTRGRHPGIITWPDIAGLREAYQVMATRLAEQGYAVLALNYYYRHGPAPQYRDFAEF